MSEQIQDLFRNFIQDTIKVFPEYDKRLNKYYSVIIHDEDDDDDEKKSAVFSDFMENIEDITKDVCDENLKMFEKDPIILQNVSFKVIWESNITNDTRLSIWKYLQSFCMYNFNKSQGDIDEIIKTLQQNEKVKDKENLLKAKRLKKLSESIKNSSIEAKLNGNPEVIEGVLENDESMKQMEDILENTGIGKIAKEVTEELDIEGMLGEGGGIEDIMKGDNMMNIFQSISSKIEGANLGGGNIMEEAMGITKNMKDNPLFSSMFSSLSKMDPSKSEAFAEAKENTDNRRIRLTNSHDGSETKKRLQKKLKEKEGKLEVNKKQ
jgi:hypothetical protein